MTVWVFVATKLITFDFSFKYNEKTLKMCVRANDTHTQAHSDINFLIVNLNAYCT